VEVAEMKNHPWMVGSQFHPELRSRPNRPHPLFAGLISAAINHLPDADQRPMPLERAVV
jgi:CTP synthase